MIETEPKRDGAPAGAKPAKVLAISSGGGHWVQLRRLSPVLDVMDVAYVTTDPHYEEEVAGRRFYAVRDVNRWDRFGFVVLTVQLARIFVRERPRVVITTGAAPCLIALAMAKALGARTIWIDSIANCERLSTSGRYARFVADVWLTQWPHLGDEKGPKYLGAVL